VDRSSIEVFAQAGLVAMTDLVYPPDGAGGIEFVGSSGSPGQLTVDLWELKSTWK
jgi:sucrose-6-phosphate hydrolase SacC (GH32 family)